MSNSINRTLSRFFSQSYRTATTSRTRSSAIASQVTSKPSNHIRIHIPIPTSSQFRPSINRKFYSTSPCTPTAASPSLAKVPNRSILEFKGRDTLKLLQGLISNDVRIFEKGAAKYEENKGIYAVFLYPNGRLVADVLIYQHPSTTSVTPHLLLECDSRALPSLITFIKKFKLRSKVTIKDVTSSWQVWQAWGDEEVVQGKGDLELEGEEQEAKGMGMVVVKDERNPRMGRRVVVGMGVDVTSKSHRTVSSDEYSIHRILQGVPEGPLDFVDTSSLPLEMNCDYMNGVDFRKGCYVGQELTARTHHTGVVRKRVLPINFYKEGESAPTSLSFSSECSLPLPISGTEIRSFPISTSTSDSTAKRPTRGKAAGKFSSGIGNVGLACLRLEQVKRWSEDSNSKDGLGMSIQTDEGTLLVRPWLQDWWPAEPEEVKEERQDQYGEGVSE